MEIGAGGEYGLSAALIINDMRKALDLSMRLEFGTVYVNDTAISDEPHAPLIGAKNSGFGRESGRYLLEELTEVKWMMLQMGSASSRSEGRRRASLRRKRQLRQEPTREGRDDRALGVAPGEDEIMVSLLDVA